MGTLEEDQGVAVLGKISTSNYSSNQGTPLLQNYYT